MKIPIIIHQQICQLRWHLLACVGLIMVLPVEEALVNLKAGGGFYSLSLAIAAVTFGPLLAGLIACANVQADLDQERYIFWRSKPANVKLLMTLKYFVGLIASLIVLACPVVFAMATVVLFAKERVERESMYSMPFLVLIAVMTYSLCFACNVLVRKSARAWLIGMLVAGLLLVLPFVLPLNYRDLVTDTVRWTLSAYLTIILGASAAAFVFSLYATQHDWHLRTNLKGLLWVGAGLLFVLMMLFSSQVANIKVLDEKQIDSSWGYPSWGRSSLDTFDNTIIFQGQSYVDVDKGRISLRRIESLSSKERGVSSVPGNLGTDSASRQIVHSPSLVGYRMESYPRSGDLYKSVDGQIYSFSIIAYFQIEKEGHLEKRIYEKIYLRSHKLIGESWMAVNELDISECLTNRTDILRMAMRLIDNVIVACINESCVVVDVTEPSELKRIATKLRVLKFRYSVDREKEFVLPLIPVKAISIEEQIKLSIDLNYAFPLGRNDIHKSSIVDIHDGKIAFFRVSQEDIARFDVVRWDQEKIYCKFSSARPFTILESIGGLDFLATFVKGGNLYCYGQGTLLVFDVRSNRGIRKLGHFVRMDYRIEDIAVLNDGNILLCIEWERNFDSDPYKPRKPSKSYLCLLKNPA